MRSWLLARTWDHRWQADLARLVVALMDLVEDLYDEIASRLHPRPWAVYDEDTGVHVLPLSDHIEHQLDGECICGPDIEWTDPDTDETYENGPLITHHSLDGREHAEVEAVRNSR